MMKSKLEASSVSKKLEEVEPVLWKLSVSFFDLYLCLAVIVINIFIDFLT